MDWAKRSEVRGSVQMVSSIESVVIGGEGMGVRVCLASYNVGVCASVESNVEPYKIPCSM